MKIGLVASGLSVLGILVFNSPWGASAQHGDEVVFFDGQDFSERAVLPRPHTWVDATSIPRVFDWGNVNGKNFQVYGS